LIPFGEYLKKKSKSNPNNQKRRKTKYDPDLYFKFWCKVQSQCDLSPKSSSHFINSAASKKLLPPKWEETTYFPSNLEMALSKENLPPPSHQFPKGAPDYVLGLYLNEFKVRSIHKLWKFNEFTNKILKWNVIHWIFRLILHKY
jgi:hypothetical protein